MDPSSGRIYQVTDDEDAKKRGLMPIPRADLPRVKKMNMRSRMAWALRHGAHPAAPVEGQTPEEARSSKNARKRERRALRGK